MKRFFRERFQRDMVRPLIYKAFTRGVLSLFVIQLLHFFLPSGWPLASFANLTLGAGILFALFSWLAWLRLDGLKLPQLRLPRLKRKDPPFLTGDMADHIDDDITTFDDLDEDGQNVCVFLADLALTAVHLLLALFL